jgi:phytoene dehydrogenase-like protein
VDGGLADLEVGVSVSAPVPFPRDQRHAALVARLAALRHDLDDEMAARARAEAEADEAGALVRELRLRLEAEERVTRWLRRTLGSRLLRGAWPFVLAGLAGGFLAVLALRWAGM